jgi:hypothetical protein
MSRQAQFERDFLKEELQGFNASSSPAWRLLTELYGSKISKDEIIALGQVASIELKIELVREYKRRKETMIKWFERHLAEVEPFLRQSVKIISDENTPAPKETV